MGNYFFLILSHLWDWLEEERLRQRMELRPRHQRWKFVSTLKLYITPQSVKIVLLKLRK